MRCPVCAKEIPASNAPGRPRRYCSRSCRQRAYRDRHARVVHDTRTDVGRRTPDQETILVVVVPLTGEPPAQYSIVIVMPPEAFRHDATAE